MMGKKRKVPDKKNRQIIVYILDVSGRGGIAHYISLLGNALVDRGIEVVVVTTRNNELDQSVCRFVYKKILFPHYHQKFYIVKGFIYLFSLLRFFILIHQRKPDVIHWHEIKIPFVEYFFIRYLCRKEIQTIYTAHDVLSQEKHHITRSLCTLYNQFDLVIAHAEDSKMMIHKVFSVPENE